MSSPATVPSTSGSPARSRADATTWAEPGGVRSTTRFALCATSTTNSPITRRRWSSGAARSLACSGIAYAIAPPGMRTLTAPSSSRSRLTVACVAIDAVGGEHLDQLGLAGDRLLLEQPRDAVLALGLAERRHQRTHRLRARCDEHGARRVHAVGGLLPHGGPRAVDHRRRDLFAAVGGQAVQEPRLGLARTAASRRRR